eukprot:CAMPEP_0174913090 /NCGR_PEP_ID=MMETSP0167-20121228/80134_1 /TAXON_ID=38298 /ORGANISM="Rhodella maculata, Strain CCMP736" /LENGTH=118 /DNA_ID=CAMNT_0016157783 /DNA_START=745 /DNA_END=1101 /DNA_ORIENTATION=+
MKLEGETIGECRREGNGREVEGVVGSVADFQGVLTWRRSECGSWSPHSRRRWVGARTTYTPHPAPPESPSSLIQPCSSCIAAVVSSKDFKSGCEVWDIVRDGRKMTSGVMEESERLSG